MNLGFLELPPADRRLYFRQGAALRGVSPVILEKDFWVCWLLSILFQSEFASILVFKGGTSLSKVFRAIDRFSEDIDLSVSPSFLELPAPGTSRNQSNKWMTKAETACADAIRLQITPVLNETVSRHLGAREQGWFEYQIDPTSHSPILGFDYPTLQPPGFAYLRRSITLEFGSLTDQQPVGRHAISPWIVETLPSAFPEWRCEVVALEIERTFWEKATILHAEFHRPSDKMTPLRYSRHYADMAALANHPICEKALGDSKLRNRVVAWKTRFFGSSWANYEQAQPGTFRLVPPPQRQLALGRDYQAMQDMYLNRPPQFQQILATLAELELRINRGH
jgi:hypothetical protein